MPYSTNLDDISGIESIKLGFFREVQRKISELKSSNIQLEQKRQDVQAILDGIPDVMAVISKDFELLSVNKSFYNVYGEMDIKGIHCHSLFKNQDKPCDPCPIAIAAECSTRVSRILQIFNWRGEKRQIECSASLMKSASNGSYKFLLMQRDVTLEKQYQAKYFQAERMATIGVLAEGVAHEINNPLTSISGFAEALARRLDKLKELSPKTGEDAAIIEDFDEYLQTILKECGRCSAIVHNLLTFGHRDIKHLAMVNLNDIVANCLKLLKPRLSRMPEDLIRLDLDATAPFVLGHPGELMQVLLNLVLNALYAVRKTGFITISTAVSENMVMLRVSDTGMGIPQENLNKLFEPFFTTKPPGQGIGIGLSTCYNIIKKHGGEITVESEQSKGAVFEVVLAYLSE